MLITTVLFTFSVLAIIVFSFPTVVILIYYNYFLYIEFITN